MEPLTLGEILPIPAFEAIRETLREAVMRHKAARRVPVGDRVTLVFEDRETVRWQVQEMCRVEGIHESRGVAGELAVYNELVPRDGELSATLFVEITEAVEIRPELDRLIGIDEHVTLQVGDLVLPARFDPKQMDEERISAVQYVRFAIPEQARAKLGNLEIPVQLRIDHPHYQASVFLSPATRASLCRDLEGGAGPLVDPSSIPAASAPEVLRESGSIRVIRPAAPRGPGHRVVESAADTGFADASPEQLAELMAVAQEEARGIEAAHGACVLVLDTRALRCHLHAPR